MRLVVADGVKPVLAGLTVGVLVAMIAVRLLRGMVFEMAPVDPLSFAAAAALLALVATGAAIVPARRAARVDPLVALRDE